VFSFAQNPHQTRVINGIEYYVYSVQQGEGLFRISQNFGVSQDEITRINPEIKDGLRAGQIILIPRRAQAQQTVQTPPSANVVATAFGGGNNQPAPAEQRTTAENREPDFHFHTVERRQTLFSLSQQYGVTQEDIVRYNPQAARGLRTGEVIRIPRATNVQAETRTGETQQNVSEEYFIHTVEARETLFSISRKYNISQADIERLNMDLDVLSIGRELRIPRNATSAQTTDAVSARTTSFLDWRRIFGRQQAAGDTTKLRIAFLLPFSLENRSNVDIRFLEFYAGAVKAIFEAQANGISLDIHTFDTGTTAERVQDVFAQNPILREVDLIIGPAHHVQVPIVTQFAHRYRVKTLIPLSNRVPDIERNPYIFQFNPGMNVEIDFLRQMFDTQFANMNIIFANIEGVPETDEGAIISQEIRQMLDERRRAYSALSISTSENNLLELPLASRARNLIIFNTNQFQLIQAFLANLNVASRDYDITIFERYGWKSRDVRRPNGIYVAPFRPENEILHLRNYEQNFVNLFGWEATYHSPRYDILGYDLVNYFIRILNDKENDIANQLQLEAHRDGLQSQFRFVRRSLDSGFINQQMYFGNSQVR